MANYNLTNCRWLPIGSRTIAPLENCSMDNCPPNNCPLDDFPRTIAPEDNCPPDNCPPENFPLTIKCLQKILKQVSPTQASFPQRVLRVN